MASTMLHATPSNAATQMHCSEFNLSRNAGDANYPLLACDSVVSEVKFVMGIIGVIFGVLSILLNFAFLMAMQFLKNCSTAHNRLMQSLSFADALASLSFIIVMWPKSSHAGIDTNKNYVLAEAVPYVTRSIPWMFFTGYLLTLSSMTVNQYMAVCKPWKYTDHIMKRLVCVLLISIWLVSSLQILIPLVILIVLYHHDDKHEAAVLLFHVSRIEIQVWMAIFILSSLFNVFLDLLVYRKIRLLKLKRRFSMGPGLDSRNIRMKQEAFITVTLLLLASIFCRLPFPLMGIIYQNVYIQQSAETTELIHAVLVLLLYINFFVDPLIYIIRMKDVRQIYKRLIRKYVYCNDSSPRPSEDNPEGSISRRFKMSRLKHRIDQNKTSTLNLPSSVVNRLWPVCHSGQISY